VGCSGGIGVAYLVTVLPALATGTAYFQCVWSEAREKPTNIGQFDWMFGALDNLLEIRHIHFWFKKSFPIMAVVIVWYVLPVA